MILSEMVQAISNRCDDAISTQLATDFLNSGQNLLAMEVGASFSQLNFADPNSTFDFPSKYHEIPVIYACMRFKEFDSVLTEASSYRAQFEQMKKLFIATYELPAYLRDDRLAQQFTSEAGQTAFVITKDGYEPTNSDLIVYKNGSRMVSWSKVVSSVIDEADVVTTNTTTNDPRGFILTNPCVSGDRVTAVWEEHQDVIEPPVPWWKGQGW